MTQRRQHSRHRDSRAGHAKSRHRWVRPVRHGMAEPFSGVYIYMATLNVGAGQAYATLSAAVSASRDGDVIAVQAGTYVNDFATISKDITIVGVGGMANFVATVAPPNGKGILVTQSNVTIQNLSFSGVAVADGNGAGIRYEGGNLVVIDSYFHDNQMNLLATVVDPAGTIRIVGSEFGATRNSDSLNHNLYVGNIGSLVIDDSYFHDAYDGHQIKSRAQSTTITNSRIYDGAGAGSYTIDLPNGGVGIIRNNVIQQGPNSDNPGIIDYGGESDAYAGSSLLIKSNVVVNDMSSSGARLLYSNTTVTGTIRDNSVYGLTAGQIALGSAMVSGTTFLSTQPTLDTSSTGLRADLVVSSIALGNASVAQGQNLGFVYTVVKDGAAQSNLGYANFYIDGLSEAYFRGYNLTDPLGRGGVHTLFNGFNTSNLSVGQHTLWVGADNFGQTAESNETNNWRSITFTVTAPPQADLVVSSLGLGACLRGRRARALGFVYTIVNNGRGAVQRGLRRLLHRCPGCGALPRLQPHRPAGLGGIMHTVQRLQYEQSQRRPAHAVGRGRQFRPDEREQRDQQLAGRSPSR